MKLDSIHYTISQVSELTNIPQSALRYWESVFDVLNPDKSPGGNRRYSEHDIKIIFKIKELLYSKGFTIKGANLQLVQEFDLDDNTLIVQEIHEPAAPASSAVKQMDRKVFDQDTLKAIIRELKSILRMLEE